VMGRELLDHHRELLEASVISPEVIAARGYWTATRKAELEQLGFARYQRIVPSLVVPIRDVRGRVVNYQARPDQPRIESNGRPCKYESPAGIPPTLDVPPHAAGALGRAHAPLWVTEGARKADSAVSAGLCCVSLPGVWSWAKRLNGDARQVLPDLQRVKLEDRKVVLAFDSDVMAKPQVHKALEALHAYLVSQGALVRFLYLPELEAGEKTGLDDFLARHAVEELWRHVEGELRAPPESKEKHAPALPTAMLLAAVEKLLRRYVHFPDDHGPAALALFVLHTWAVDAFRVTPYVYVKSPQKRSGKTRTLEALELVCRSPLRAASITEAALYQAVEVLRPTLLIDEVDAIFTSKSERAEALRGVLNAGNARGAKVIRGAQDGVPQISETFCCKVLSGIDTGKLPDTIRDRAIVIGLERKKRTEAVERFRVDDIADQLDKLRIRLEDWAAAETETLAGYRCEPLAAISERLEEAWEPLLAIAETAGGKWPERAREAARALAKGTEDVEDHGEILLAALKRIFGDHDAAFTANIVTALNENDELPFGAYRRGDGIDGRRLAAMLRPYGVRPGSVRIGETHKKGYLAEHLDDVWERYLPADGVRARDPGGEAGQAGQAGHPADRAESAGTTSGTEAGQIALVPDREPPCGTEAGQPEPALESQNPDAVPVVPVVPDEVQPSVRARSLGRCGTCGGALERGINTLWCVACSRAAS
jgi:hypothetical protein